MYLCLWVVVLRGAGVDLKIRLQALQRENRQLRASARAERFQSRMANEARENAMEASSITCQRRCSSFQPLSGACRASRVCPSRAKALAKAAVHPAAPAYQHACRGSLICGALHESRRPELPRRPAVVDLHVRLPHVKPSTALPPLSCEHACQENHCTPLERVEDQQSEVQCKAEATKHIAGALKDAKYIVKPARCSSNFRQQTKLMSAGSTACQTDHMTTSDDSIRSSTAGTTQRKLERVARKGISQRPRSVSHESLTTSTSSSCPGPRRQVAGLRGRSLSSSWANNAKRYRIVCIPETDSRRLLQDEEMKPANVKFLQLTARGGHKPALRRDIAGRLQAFLRRLQERQMLHAKMHSFAKQL